MSPLTASLPVNPLTPQCLELPLLANLLAQREYAVHMNNGHIGTSHFVLYREVILSLEVKMHWYI